MNHFEILGVPLDATQEQVAAAYRTRARQLHPDTKPDATPAEQLGSPRRWRSSSSRGPFFVTQLAGEYLQHLERGAPGEEEILVRMPANDECVMCGSHPATVLMFRHQRCGNALARSRFGAGNGLRLGSVPPTVEVMGSTPENVERASLRPGGRR